MPSYIHFPAQFELHNTCHFFHYLVLIPLRLSTLLWCTIAFLRFRQFSIQITPQRRIETCLAIALFSRIWILLHTSDNGLRWVTSAGEGLTIGTHTKCSGSWAGVRSTLSLNVCVMHDIQICDVAGQVSPLSALVSS